jgi:tetraacyldisaccharide 4'-kinase
MWERYFISVIKGQRKGAVASLLRFVLWLISIPYQVVVYCRNWMFDRGWLRKYVPPVPLVISIGNITAGGTGKTPLTLLLAESLKGKVPLAILSRGYRSVAERFSAPIVLHKQQGLTHPASLCGDEPFLLAENLPDVPVIVGRNRSLASKMAAKMGIEAIILDDGMQHRGIARDLEVVIMDLLDPFGQGYFLPRGLLREGKSALARADLIVLNHASDLLLLERVKKQISSISSAPIVGTRVEVVGLFDLKGKEELLHRGDKAAIFCAIAHPEHFRITVQEMGFEVVSEMFLPDHDTLNLSALEGFAAKALAGGAKRLLCTEKDRVKMACSVHLDLPICWVKTRLVVVEGEESWQGFVSQAKQHLKVLS